MDGRRLSELTRLPDALPRLRRQPRPLPRSFMGEGGAVIRTTQGRAGLHPGDNDRQIVTDFRVDNIEASVQQVGELGGQTDDPGAAEEGFGQFVTCRDDQRVAFGSTSRVDLRDNRTAENLAALSRSSRLRSS